MDRRILKTKSDIYSAFLSILTNKNYDEIKISDISKKANINRGTFYLHFKDKHDLLKQCSSYYIKVFFFDCNLDNPDNLLHMTFKSIQDNIETYKVLFNSDISYFFKDVLSTMLFEKYSCATQSYKTKDNSEIVNRFIAAGVVGIIEWWVINSMPLSIENMVSKTKSIFSILSTT